MNKLNFNTIVNNIKSLNIKEIHNWPIWANIVSGILVFITVLLLGSYFVLSEQYSNYNKEKERENTLKQEFIAKKRQAINLDLYKRQLSEIIQVSDDLLKQLPNKSEVEKLLIYINQAGISRGLHFELFKPGTEKLNEFYAELPISIKVIGDYNSIGLFTADVSQLSRVVLLKDISLSVDKGGFLTMETTAKTFRYLDQAEVDQQKAEKKKEKEANDKKNKKNKKNKPKKEKAQVK